MRQYLNFTSSATKYSLGHHFGSIYKKIEFGLFIILSIIFLVAGKANQNFSAKISTIFINISNPIITVISFPLNSVIAIINNTEELINAKNNNQILREENDKLRSFYLSAINIKQEDQELKNMLKLTIPVSSDYKIAKVISRAHEIFNQNLLIELDKNYLPKPGNIVTGSVGVVGRIAENYQDKSRVTLITDANSRIPIITSNARVRGILVGNNSQLMKILYLPKNHLIKPNDLVFTSADGDTLPPGLFVGIVKKVNQDEVEVEMAEDISKLNFVSIINY
jgi:rod shape-determining protein MreC